MTTLIRIDGSQYPDRVMADLKDCFRRREVNHKFHYDSVKQTQRWLALHQAYSPSRTDTDCADTYVRAFAEAAQRIPPGPLLLTGLGCGGGQKDRRLVEELRKRQHQVDYLATDVSTAMVLCACHEVGKSHPAALLPPLVWDLARVQDLGTVLQEAVGNPADAGKTRLFSFFGMIPNFEPEDILPKLRAAIRPGDWLLFSANLAPGPEYKAGVERIRPLYDNELTREWLIQFLLDAGVEREDGAIRFTIESDSAGLGLLRIVARFEFLRPRTIEIDGERFAFGQGDRIRLFFSYRHTPDLVKKLLRAHGMTVEKTWVTASGEEGVFLVTRKFSENAVQNGTINPADHA
jgi:uncharacterized SAM-dependent methyltransferase